jgi:hypothetical protein
MYTVYKSVAYRGKLAFMEDDQGFKLFWELKSSYTVPSLKLLPAAPLFPLSTISRTIPNFSPGQERCEAKEGEDQGEEGEGGVEPPALCSTVHLVSSQDRIQRPRYNRERSLLLIFLCVAGRSTGGRWCGGWGRSQIVRRRGSLDIYKSLNTLCSSLPLLLKRRGHFLQITL